MTVSFEQAAWAWTEHLRAGGSRPWSEWVAAAEGVDASVPRGWVPPGAAQLELVRRANAVTGRGLPAGLADLAFSRSGPARGLAHLPLGWPGSRSPRAFGAPLTDPADVPCQELVRVGVGVLAELLLRHVGRDAGLETGEWRVRRRLLRRGRAFELAGAPVTTAAVRHALALGGHVEGGRAPRVVLLAEPFDRALAQVWSARVQQGAPVRWRGFVARAAHGPELPPSADLPGLARWWADRVGREQVHVVVAPGSHASATRLTAEVLGLPPRRPRAGRAAAARPPRVLDLTPPAVDVARRVNAVLAVRATERQHARAVRILSRLLATGDTDTGPRQPFTVPRAFQDWARDRAEGIAEELRRGDYAVHGDLARIMPASQRLPTQPDRDTVLRLVLTACVDLGGEDLRATKGRDR